MTATVEINHADETSPFIAVEHHLDQPARHTERFGGNRKVGLGEHTLERSKLLAVVVRVDDHLLDQLVEFGIGPLRHKCHGRPPKRMPRTALRFYRFFYRMPMDGTERRRNPIMDGYVARKGNRWYAVIYHGLDPVTGREQRTWHAAGTDRAAAEKLARKLAKETVGRDDGNRSLTFGAYLTQRWLPAKKIELAPTTFHGYQRIVHLHVLPSLGTTKIRSLTPDHLEALYSRKLAPTDGARPLSRKSVLEIHTVIRGALSDALGTRHHQPERRLRRPSTDDTQRPAGRTASLGRRAATHVPAGRGRSPAVRRVQAERSNRDAT